MDTKKSCKWVGGPNKGILLLPWLIYVIRWYVCYWKVWESCCCFSDCCCCCVCLQVCVLRLWPVSVIRWLMHYTDTGGWPLESLTSAPEHYTGQTEQRASEAQVCHLGDLMTFCTLSVYRELTHVHTSFTLQSIFYNLENISKNINIRKKSQSFIFFWWKTW